MKQFKTMIIFVIFACCFITACSSNAPQYALPKDRETRVSNESLNDLRKQYPIDNQLYSNASYGFDHMQTWDDYSLFYNADTIVLLQISGDLFSENVQMSPFGNEELLQVDLTCLFSPVHVLEVLAGDQTLEDGDLNLLWGAQAA